ncbi:hypothetical protein AAG906_018760 [Vitis piasezkii]
MAYNEEVVSSNNIWFLDSGCSNHMTGIKSLFKEDRGVNNGHGNVKLLYNVYFIPSLTQNLLSVGQLMLFPLEVSSIEKHALVVKETSESNLWHLRYGHLNVKGLKLLSKKEMVFGLPKIDSVNVCEGCIYGKQSKKPFPKGRSRRTSCCLEIIHADLCGLMQTDELGVFSSIKGETFETFKKFKAFVEKQSGKCIKRKNRTVVEMARSMMKAKNLSNHFWAEGVATAVYLLNISPTKVVLNKTPYEAWYGRKPWVSHLKVFGSVAYMLIDSHNRSKLDEKSVKCIFIGYCSQSKGYKLYNPVSGKIIVSRNVVFDEKASWTWRVRNPPRKFRSLRDIYETTQVLFVADPTTFEEAEKEEWCKNETWELVELQDKNVMGVKWVFEPST